MRWTRSASLAALVAAALASGACGGGAGSGTGSEHTTTSGGCTSVPKPPPKADSSRKAPTSHLDQDKTYRVVFQTNCGEFTITLDQHTAPVTTSSFFTLARSGFFKDTIFHRIAPGFVIQGGDPTGSGTGGPGYTTVEPPPVSAEYVHYVVAMAKTGSEPPGAAGSQFFIVTGADAQLPAEYALVGKVTAGQTVVDRIGKLGDPATEKPTQPVVIQDVKAEVS